MKRRSFLQRLVYSTVILGSALMPFIFIRTVTPRVSTNLRQHLRPPGALKDDAAFVAACIGCGLCGEVCPPRCIQFHRRDGGKQANTPFINPEIKACILCNKCMQVCPTEALTETLRNEIDMGIAQIDRSACYPWVDQGVCGACVNICPIGEKAIQFKLWNQYRPLVKSGCVGCGICVEVCPHPSLPIRIVERSKAAMTPHRV